MSGENTVTAYYNGGCLCVECTTPQVVEVHTARLEVTDEWSAES